MGRIVYAEDRILQYLRTISQNDAFVTGLIIGQSTPSTDYIVHVTRLFEVDGPEEMREVKESCVSHHVRQVTHMLPGGLWVLGVFVCGTEDVFQVPAAQTQLLRIFDDLYKTKRDDGLLFANSPDKEKVALFYNSATHVHQWKTLEVSHALSAFKSADFKEWKSPNSPICFNVVCNYELDQSPRPGTTGLSLKAQLKEVLSQVSKSIETAIVTLDGEVHDNEESLAKVVARKKPKTAAGRPENQLTACIFQTLSNSGSEQSSEVKHIPIVQCDTELRFQGVVSSQVFLNQKATVGETVTAVKQDIIRSLASRLEMHWASLVREECDAPDGKEAIHEPPRRMTVPGPGVRFTEYLFPGENVKEVVTTVKDLLDVDITEADVEASEAAPDPLDLATGPANRQPNSDDYQLPVETFVAVAFIFLLLAIAVGFYYYNRYH